MSEIFVSPERPVAAPALLRLNPDLDRARLSAQFAAHGHVRVEQLFASDAMAAAVRDELEARGDWVQVINSGDKIYELSREVRSQMSFDRLRALDDAVMLGARDGFQHRYESIRLCDDPSVTPPADNVADALTRWMSSKEMLDFVRRVTGHPEIDFADAQATSYAPGDFLTGHDDQVPGKSRHAAYVLGVTQGWRIEWGGLLMFHDRHASAFHGVAPGFNTLDLFQVPSVHSVSLVSPAADRRRLSVTGWLRSRG
ncbi:2OG-Fe(II) oxygenase [Sphingomonas sanxanigenens]|uniref:Prolyl 3,4-dihydroxylase TPA1/OFD1 N-terminal domain-containing protein n=1 Tax=Sphingomonas sanxanigenens DSM 19645 = NX02 TaxID=1123269 RepID=W0AKP4_9SPHN|nr:2OG-Fe(II) oxygenase family protein [Sphingomonas sanxanigenens]AHE56873.1 hypothetical protein NX02_26395 [Sphingomonas sanxanigenens DSM 19645 = NX02]